MRKDILTLLLLILVTGMVSMPAKADGIELKGGAFDISGHWAEETMDTLTKQGLINGDENGLLRPDASITRAEFVAVLVRLLDKGDRPGVLPVFSDVKPSDWFYEPVVLAAARGWIKGEDNSFNPNGLITREEIMLIISRLPYASYTSKEASFNDIDMAYKYKSELNISVATNYISGYPDGSFKPNNSATRAEAMCIIMRIFNSANTMPSSDETQKAKVLAGDYINGLSKGKADGDFTIITAMSIGSEKHNNEVRTELSKLGKQLNIKQKETVNNLKLEEKTIAKGIIKLRADYDILVDKWQGSGQQSKSYKVSADICILKADGELKVYELTQRLYTERMPVMIWEYVGDQTPAMSGVNDMSGLNTVSPTWFEIIDGYKEGSVLYNHGSGTISLKKATSVAYMSWAKEHGYEVWPMLKNDFNSDITNQPLKLPQVRGQLIEQLIGSSGEYGFSGINVDFENMETEYKPLFTRFVNELTFSLHHFGMISSVDISPYDAYGGNWSLCFDRKALGKTADYTAVMAYDQNGLWSIKPGSVAQLSWVENKLKNTLESVEGNRLILCVPFYTRVWGTRSDSIISANAVSMESANGLIKQNNATVAWDDKSGQNIASWTDQKGDKYYIWVEDAKSIALKAALVNKYKLAGIAGWRRGYETADIWPIMSPNR